MWLLLILAIILCAALTGCYHVQVVSADALVLTNGTVVDGTGADTLTYGTTVIQNGRILKVGRFSDFLISPGAKVIDVDGATIMPGIINAHVHNSHHLGVRRSALTNGITSLCDVGSPPQYLPEFERDYNNQNELLARGFQAGPILTVAGFSKSLIHFEVGTAEEAKAAVIDLVDQGADMIKIALEPGSPEAPLPVLTSEQVQVIVDAAHALEVPVRAHVRQSQMLDVALETGIDVVDHVPCPFSLRERPEQIFSGDRLDPHDLSEVEKLLGQMAEQGIILVPTLEINLRSINCREHLNPAQQQAIRKYLFETVALFQEQGGMIALGTDSGNPATLSKMPLNEMALLLEAGLSHQEVIQAATKHAAMACGQGNVLGTIEPGKLADIIIVDGDPLSDIYALRRVEMVIRDGQVAFVEDRGQQETENGDCRTVVCEPVA